MKKSKLNFFKHKKHFYRNQCFVFLTRDFRLPLFSLRSLRVVVGTQGSLTVVKYRYNFNNVFFVSNKESF